MSLSGSSTFLIVLGSWLRRRLLLATDRQRHDRIGGAGMGDEVVIVRAERTREPTSRHALVLLEPVDAALDFLVLARQAGLAQHEKDEAGAIAVARTGLVVLRPARGLVTLVVAQRRQVPAAVRPLQRQQLLHGVLLFFFGREA